MAAGQTYCEFCGDGTECGVCGRGRSTTPTCWEVFNPKTKVILFRTKYHWFAFVWCNVFAVYEYAPEGWGMTA